MELRWWAGGYPQIGIANFLGLERERECLETRRAEQMPAATLAQLSTNQVLIEMAIHWELVTVPVVNVNLTQPIRMTTKTSSRELQVTYSAYATGITEDNG